MCMLNIFMYTCAYCFYILLNKALYYLPTPINVIKGQKLMVLNCHNDDDLWFNVIADNNNTDVSISVKHQSIRSICSCGFHVAYSPQCIFRMNLEFKFRAYVAGIPGEVCLDLSAGPLISIEVAREGNMKRIICVEVQSRLTHR